MKHYILILSVFLSLSLFAQNHATPSVSCFADVHFGKSTISIQYEQGINPRLSPQLFHHLVVVSPNIFKEYCQKPSDIKNEANRIKAAIQSAKVADLTEEEQSILLQQLALSLIWNKLFEPDTDIIQSQINELELYSSEKNKENIHLIINLYHRVFDGK